MCAVGKQFPMVRVPSEEVAIIFDSKHGVEHFIRRASFSTSAPDFAFIAPTSNRPQLGEADTVLFDELRKLILPEPMAGGGGSKGAAGAATGRATVKVVHQQAVAGMHATILRARHAGDLQKWLTKNGYATPAGFAEWVRPYLSGDWHLTAFKFLRKGEASDVSTKAIRMTFKTSRPFYPYRVPEAEDTRGRDLRIFAIAQFPLSAQTGGVPWSGEVRRPGQIRSATFIKLLALATIDPDLAPDRAVLTVFHDDGSNRTSMGDMWMHPLK